MRSILFSRLLKYWQAIGSRGRKPDLPFPIIITTNFDAGLERVFEQEGIPYDLVWLVAEGSNRGKWLHLGYRAEGRVVLPRPGTGASRKGPGFPFGKGIRANPDPNPRVIIIKIFGSINDPSCRRVTRKMHDEDDYFLITQDQMESFFSDRVDDLSDALVRVIRSMKLLFIGFSPNDPDLRAIVDRLYARKRCPSSIGSFIDVSPGSWTRRSGNLAATVKLLRVVDSLEQTMIDLERGVRDDSRTV